MPPPDAAPAARPPGTGGLAVPAPRSTSSNGRGDPRVLAAASRAFVRLGRAARRPLPRALSAIGAAATRDPSAATDKVPGLRTSPHSAPEASRPSRAVSVCTARAAPRSVSSSTARWEVPDERSEPGEPPQRAQGPVYRGGTCRRSSPHGFAARAGGRNFVLRAASTVRASALEPARAGFTRMAPQVGSTSDVTSHIWSTVRVDQLQELHRTLRLISSRTPQSAAALAHGWGVAASLKRPGGLGQGAPRSRRKSVSVACTRSTGRPVRHRPRPLEGHVPGEQWRTRSRGRVVRHLAPARFSSAPTAPARPPFEVGSCPRFSVLAGRKGGRRVHKNKLT